MTRSRARTTNKIDRVRSRDGTAIAFDRLGGGRPVILVAGAFSYRRYPSLMRLAELLAPHFNVVNYDRRGRGDSGDTTPYAVERELEDLEALIDAVGGSACLWGWSSGAALALRAAASSLDVGKLAVYQPPFIVDDSGHLPPEDFSAQLSDMTAADRRSDAVRYFMTEGMGVPATFVTMMRLYPPMWSRLTAVAHTLPYDEAVMGDTIKGRPLSAEPWASVTAPTLVIDGGKSPPQFGRAAQALADVLPNAQRRTLEGQAHNVKMKVLAPALVEFFGS